MAENNESERQRLAQASRYIRQAVKEILQQSLSSPTSTRENVFATGHGISQSASTAIRSAEGGDDNRLASPIVNKTSFLVINIAER